VIVTYLPRDSALVREIHGEEALAWDITNQLLGVIADRLGIANWQRAGGKRKDAPKPIPRPGIEQPKKYGGQAVSMEEMAQRLARRRHLSVVPDPD
jgi:hypothetical protein